jgi:hypothetical protein
VPEGRHANLVERGQEVAGTSEAAKEPGSFGADKRVAQADRAPALQQLVRQLLRLPAVACVEQQPPAEGEAGLEHLRVADRTGPLGAEARRSEAVVPAAARRPDRSSGPVAGGFHVVARSTRSVPEELVGRL